MRSVSHRLYSISSDESLEICKMCIESLEICKRHVIFFPIYIVTATIVNLIVGPVSAARDTCVEFCLWLALIRRPPRSPCHHGTV